MGFFYINIVDYYDTSVVKVLGLWTADPVFDPPGAFVHIYLIFF